MAWRVARSLEKLRDQIDAAAPRRNKASDGTIGDADHQNRESDHNPWCGPGVVTAIDITHDPAKGVDIDKLTDDLQRSRDSRIKYVIANNMIMSGSSGPSPWVWRSYSGSNPHTRHFHLSVNCNASKDNTRPWELPSLRGIGGSQPIEPTPREDEDMPLTDDEKNDIAERTATAIMRRDGVKVPWDNPKNPRFQVRYALAGMWADSWQNKRNTAQLARAIEALSNNQDATIRDAVHEALKDVNVTTTVNYDDGSQE